MAHEKSDVDGRGVGRPKKLGPEQSDLLRRVALENPALSVDDIMRLFTEASGVTLARMTAYSYLNKAGAQGEVATADDDQEEELRLQGAPSR